MTDGIELAKKTPGIKWTRFTGGSWGLFEKQPPEGGNHSYDFEVFDARIKGVQDSAGNAVFVLHPTASWAMDLTQCNNHCAPRAEYWDDWKQFVKTVLERYDHDGIDDMPGLQKGFDYFEIGNEYQNPDQWSSSAQDYVDALRYAYEAKKEANPDAMIIVGGFTHLNDLKSYEENPEQVKDRRVFTQSVYEFTMDVLSYPQYFDMLDVHFFAYLKYRPDTVTDGMTWIKSVMEKKGYSKPIVCLEWTGAFSYRFDPEFDEEKLTILLTGEPSDGYMGTRDEFEKEQAVEFSKMFIGILGEGCRLAIYDQFSDFPTNLDLPLWLSQGIVRADRNTHEILEPKPAYYVYGLLNDKLSGISRVERLSLGAEIRAYRFSINEKKIIAAWTDGGRQIINVKPTFNGDEVKVTRIAIQGGDRVSTETLEPSDNIEVSVDPLIIE